eukprot:gene11827-5158_t
MVKTNNNTKRIVLKKDKDTEKVIEFKTLSDRFDSYFDLKKASKGTKETKKEKVTKKETVKTPEKVQKQKKTPAKKTVKKKTPQLTNEKLEENLDQDLENYFKSGKPADESGSFYEFQKVCEELSNESSHKGKTDIIEDYLSTFEGDVYLFLKLILPKADHRKYNMKEKKLIKICSGIFGADEDDMLTDLEQGDVSETLSKYFKESRNTVKWSTLTLKQVDDFLTKLTTLSKVIEQERALTQFLINKATANDLKYLTRLIVGDLKTYAGAKYVLAGFHIDAFDVFQVSQNLKMVFDRIMKKKNSTGYSPLTPSIGMSFNDDDFDSLLKQDPNDKDDEDDSSSSSSESEKEIEEKEGKKKKEKKTKAPKQKVKAYIQLDTPVKPMLARASKTYEDAIKRCPNGFFIETKYDGERIQIHKNGDEFHCYSRSLKPIVPNKYQEVKKYISKAIKEDKVILDGEILLVDLKTGNPLPFGTLGTHKKKQFTDAVVGIFIFDILYLNGKSLLNTPLEKRRQVLEKVVKLIPNRIMLSEYTLCDGSIEDREALLSLKMTNAIEQALEGLVLKDLQSTYEPGARHWIKMKKDYLKGMADSADLIVLGGYYGSGSKGGLLSVFLMGCYDTKKKCYRTVCKAGNGHDDDTIQELQNQLTPNMIKIQQDNSKVPGNILVERSITPDWIVDDPLKSQVWEISGAEFSQSKKFSAGFSIRFPRVTKVRDDKEVEEATTYQELMDLVEASKRTSSVLLSDLVKPKTRDEIAANKRQREEEEMDEMLEDDDIIEELPKKKQKIEKSKEIIDATLEYHFGNVVQPKDSKNCLIVHSVDNSGNWSTRGVMGQITKKFGDSIEKEYKKCNKNKSNNGIGDIQTINISKEDNIYICNIIAQKASRKGGAPDIDYTGFKYGLKEAAKFAKKNQLTIHFSKFHHAIPNLDSTKVEDIIKETIKSTNVSFIVYTRDDNDKSICGKKIQFGEKKSQLNDDDVDDDDDNPFNLKLFGDDETPKTPKEKVIELISEDPMDEEDFGKSNIFENMNVVISGYSDNETKEIKKLFEDAGGKVQNKWSLIGNKTTHLICETFTTVYDHVEKLGGKIVNRNWIDQSLKRKKKLKEFEFIFPQPEIEKQEKKTISSSSVSANLTDIFPDDSMVHINHDLKDYKKLKRLVFAYGGVVVEKVDGNTTHLVTDSKMDVPSSFKGKIVKSKWIWDSVEEETLKNENDYKL